MFVLRVAFPLRLEPADVGAPDAVIFGQYTLTAVVVCVGIPRSHAGVYVALVRHGDQWVECGGDAQGDTFDGSSYDVEDGAEHDNALLQWLELHASGRRAPALLLYEAMPPRWSSACASPPPPALPVIPASRHAVTTVFSVQRCTHARRLSYRDGVASRTWHSPTWHPDGASCCHERRTEWRGVVR